MAGIDTGLELVYKYKETPGTNKGCVNQDKAIRDIY